jgi:hypothetical protein
MSLFCKVEDSNKNLYILTDKNKQPLLAHSFKNTCIIPNGKKFLNNPELLLPTLEEIHETNRINKNNDKSVFESSLFIDTKIPFTINDNRTAIVNKSDIDFNIYDIATINKDIVIKDRNYNDRQLTRIEIEQNLFSLHYIDKNKDDYYVKMKQKEIELKSKGVDEPPLYIVSEHITELYDYYQKLLTKEEYNNCIISNWTPCNDTNRTRTRTITQATRIGKACTPDENNLPLTQTCNNCIISEWSSCDNTNRTRTRTRTQALNSKACTPDENNLPLTQTCNNCIISEWSSCDNTNHTRTRTRTQALNSTACTTDENNLPLIQTCNNCIISEWSPCDYTNFTQTRTRTEALNSTACTSDENNLPLTQTCSLSSIKIYIGIFVLLIFVIAFGFYIFKPKPNQPNYQYPNQQYLNY